MMDFTLENKTIVGFGVALLLILVISAISRRSNYRPMAQQSRLGTS